VRRVRVTPELSHRNVNSSCSTADEPKLLKQPRAMRRVGREVYESECSVVEREAVNEENKEMTEEMAMACLACGKWKAWEERLCG
jgi:hypothetical protein